MFNKQNIKNDTKLGNNSHFLKSWITKTIQASVQMKMF